MNRNLVYSLVLMLISPALTLFYGLKSRSVLYKQWLLILFITVYGSIISLSVGNDGYRHQQNVYNHYEYLSFDQFSFELYRILTFQENPRTQEDPYIHILSYLTGAVLGLPQFFFVFVSFIYAYFFSKSLFRLLRFTSGLKYSWLFYGFVLVFILWKNIEGINTVRTWTGLWVLFYGALSYFETKKKKYLLLMALPPFIHIGYFAMAIPAWIVVVLGKRPLIFALIFALSFFSPIINQGIFLSELEKTEVGQSKIRGYYIEEQNTSSEILDQYSGSNWYLKALQLGVHRWGINTIAFTLIIFGVYFGRMTNLESSLFSVGLLTGALSNSTWYIYALSNRSALIAGLFTLASLILLLQRYYFQRPNTLLKGLQYNIISIAFFMMAPFIIYKLADLIQFISFFILAFPFIPWFSDEVNLSIREALGAILGL